MMSQLSLYDFFTQTGKLSNSQNQVKNIRKPIKRQIKDNIHDQTSPDRKIFVKSIKNDDETPFTQITQMSPDFTIHCERTTTLDLTDGTDKENSDTCLELTITEEVNYWNVNNFKKMLRFINTKSNMQKLFSKIDKDILMLLDNLKEDHLYLLLKLFTYLPKWYNVDKFVNRIKLNYKPKEVTLMYKELKEKCLIITDFEDETLENLLSFLDVKQINRVTKTFKLKKKKRRKKELIEDLIEHCKKQPTITPSKTMYDALTTNVKKELGHSMKLDRLVFRIFYKIFVLYTIGTELYKISDAYLFMSRINKNEIILPTIKLQDVDLFTTEESFERYVEAHEEYAKFLSAFDKKDKKTMMNIAKKTYQKLFKNINQNNRPVPLKKTLSDEYLHIKILCISSECLTKTCDPLIIIDWLKLLIRLSTHRKHGFCYKQLSLITARYIKSNNEAAVHLLEGLKNDNVSSIDLSILKDRADALIKSKSDVVCNEIKSAINDIVVYRPDKYLLKKRCIKAKTISHELTGNNKKMYVLSNSESTTFTSVEQIALSHYKTLGYCYGIHCEGSLLCTLFSVFFWDIIYNVDVEDVFITELQYLPFDLYTSDFYKNREDLIKDRLIDISFKWDLNILNNYVTKIWETHSYKRSLITLSMFQPDTLIDIITCIGRKELATLLERLASNFKEHSAGLPDLFMWNPNQSTCKFVEVKGEGDKLSMKQKYWLDFLHSNQIDCEVCLVKTEGSNRKHDI